ncbi:BTNL9 protein, partial [Polypterus senegalus]
MVLFPDTAHHELSLDDDASQIRFKGNTQGPDRWYCVTGSDWLMKGRHYWEVEVGEKSSWALGLATEEIKMSKVIPESPGNGFWIIRLCGGKQFEAVSSTVTELQEKPQERPKKVGVYQKSNELSFYNAESKRVIYTFQIEYPGLLYPVFSPGSRDKGPLIIKKKETDAFEITIPQATVSSSIGHSVVLPCHLSQPDDFKQMEVRWHEVKDGIPVIIYYRGNLANSATSPVYKGRVRLFLEKVSEGNLSLELTNVKFSDMKKYRCSVISSDLKYTAGVTELQVTATGSKPVISLRQTEPEGAQLTCETSGWYPEPKLMWQDVNSEDLTANSETSAKRDSGDLFTVTSHLRLADRSSEGISCIVKLDEGLEEKKTIYKDAEDDEKEYIQNKGYKPQTKKRQTEEKLNVSTKSSFRKAHDSENDNGDKIYSADVLFDTETAHPMIEVSDNGKEAYIGHAPSSSTRLSPLTGGEVRLVAATPECPFYSHPDMLQVLPDNLPPAIPGVAEVPAVHLEALQVSLVFFSPTLLAVVGVLRARAPQASGRPLVVTTGPYKVELLSSVPVVPKATRAVAPSRSGGGVSPPPVLLGVPLDTTPATCHNA